MSALDAMPIPKKHTAYRHYFELRHPTTRALITSWTGQDSEVSLDGAAFADCVSEATEIGTTGIGYIDLTADEMLADCVVLKVTFTNSGAVPYVCVLYPEEAGDIRASIGDEGLNSASFSDGAITEDTLADTALNVIANRVLDELLSGHVTSGSLAAAITSILAKAALITAINVQFTSMVNTDGYIDGDIIIGDDYLSANGRAFQWTFTPNSGFVAATSTCKFGGSNADGTSTWLVTGTVTDNGNGTWTISFDLPLATTALLSEGMHSWSAECVSAGGVEITKKRSGKKVMVVRKWTN